MEEKKSNVKTSEEKNSNKPYLRRMMLLYLGCMFALGLTLVLGPVKVKRTNPTYAVKRDSLYKVHQSQLDSLRSDYQTERYSLHNTYQHQLDSSNNAYQHQLDSLEKDYQIKLKNLEEKFFLPLGNN